MATFSASDAALAGFQVLRRHWRVAVGWAVFNLVAMVAVVVVGVVVGVVLNVSGGKAAERLASGAVAGVAALGTVMVEVVIVTGLYRLRLRPQDPGFLHLRLGRDELRMAGVTLIVLCAAGLLAAAAYGLSVALYPFAGAAPVLADLAALGVAIWLGLRFSLAGATSFAGRRLDFLGSWRLTRGRNWPLVGMWLLNLCILGVLWVVLWLAMFVVTGLFTGFGDLGASGPEALQSHPGRYLLEAAASLLLTPIVLILQQAPYVAAYQALREP
jgi:hypothetical protein